MAIDAGVLTQITEHYKEDILKILFEDGTDTTPLLAMCEARKVADGFGRKYISRIATYEGAAVSADASIADAIAGDGNAGGRPTRQRWEIDSVIMDSTFVFSRQEVMQISNSGKKEQFKLIADEMDMALWRIRNVLAQQVSAKGWGKLAQTTAQSGTGFTVPRTSVNNFPVGRRLQAATTEDNSALLNAGAQLRVTGMDPATGIITTSADPSATWANNQTLFIFASGMRPVASPAQVLSARTAMSGLQGWIDPGTTLAMWNVARSGDPNLCGYSVSASGMDTRQGLIELCDRMFQFGRKIDTVLVSGTSWKLLNIDTDASKNIETTKIGPYQIGFKAYQLPTVFGMVDVMPDPFIEAGSAFAGPFQDKKKAPYLAYAGDSLINLDDIDGKEFERVTTSGARTFKGQFFFQGQMVIDGPGFYGKATGLPT